MNGLAMPSPEPAWLLVAPGVWAAGSASRLSALADAVPSYIEAVTLLVDDDKDGRRHATELRERLIVRGIKEVRFALADNGIARAA